MVRGPWERMGTVEGSGLQTVVRTDALSGLFYHLDSVWTAQSSRSGRGYEDYWGPERKSHSPDPSA